MNATKLKLFTTRLNQIRSEVLDNLPTHFITSEQKMQAFKEGKYVIETKNHKFYSTFEVKFPELIDNQEAREKAYHELRKKIDDEYNRILDQAVFSEEGDEILKLLDGFRNFKV